MSGVIRATCPRCGAVEVAVAQCTLSLTMAGADLRNVLAYRCHNCGDDVRERVSERATRLLVGAGIPAVASPWTPIPNEARPR